MDIGGDWPDFSDDRVHLVPAGARPRGRRRRRRGRARGARCSTSASASLLQCWLSCGPRGITPRVPGVRGRRLLVVLELHRRPARAGHPRRQLVRCDRRVRRALPAHTSMAIPVPDDVTDEVAVLADPFAVALHSITRNPPPPGGKASCGARRARHVRDRDPAGAATRRRGVRSLRARRRSRTLAPKLGAHGGLVRARPRGARRRAGRRGRAACCTSRGPACRSRIRVHRRRVRHDRHRRDARARAAGHASRVARSSITRRATRRAGSSGRRGTSRRCDSSARTRSASRRSTACASTRSSTTSTWCATAASTSRRCSRTRSGSSSGATRSRRSPAGPHRRDQGCLRLPIALLLPPAARRTRLPATDDQIAQQMVNFVYLDRRPRDRRGRRDRPRLRRPRARRHARRRRHAAHRRARRRTTTPTTSAATSAAGRSRALAELLALAGVTPKVHVQAEEAFGVKRVTGASDSDLVLHASGDIVTVGAVPITLIHTPGHTPGRSASSSTAGSSRATRCSSTAAAAPTCPAAIPQRSTRASRRSSRSCPTTRSCIPATCTRPSRPRRWARCARTTTCSARDDREQWMTMFGNDGLTCSRRAAALDFCYLTTTGRTTGAAAPHRDLVRGAPDTRHDLHALRRTRALPTGCATSSRRRAARSRSAPKSSTATVG